MSNDMMMNFAMQMIQNNPAVANNPRAREAIMAIQSGDAARGSQIAQNLCQTYGVTPDQALMQAKTFFGIR